MKFVANGTVLSDACFTVVKACAVKAVMPVLECIKVEAKNDVLKLTAYDGEISIEKEINVEVLDEGEICVNGKFFSDFIGKISFSEITVDSNDKGIIIEYGDNETYMQTLPASDFPVIKEKDVSEENYFEIRESALKELIQKVVFCCATDDSRPILKGCLLEAKDGYLYATALDGFRMACSKQEIVGGTDMKIVCPARTLIEISRMLEGNDDILKIYADKNKLSVSVKDTVITSRLYVGEFVRKENIFPVDFATVVKVKREHITASIERASVLTRGDKNNLVLMDIKNGKITIKANSDIGKVEETVSAEVEGLDLSIAMNGKFLQEAIKALEEENAVISFNTPVAPFTVENEEDKTTQYLVLPVRTSNYNQ